MLILSRRKDEAIYIGDDIRICVVELSYKQIRLGFEADPDIPIYREEIYQRLQREKKLNSR